MGNAGVKSAKKHPTPSERYPGRTRWEGPATLPAPPGKPILSPVSANNCQPDILTIRWDRSPSNGGSAIIGYLVEHRHLSSPNWLRSSANLCSHPVLDLSGLEPGWRYQFRVRAQNGIGLSQPSEPSEPVTVNLERSAVLAPRFDLELKDTISLENEQTEFVVHFCGTPVPKISWLKDGFEIFSSRRTRIVTENSRSTLLIYQTALKDEGEIRCIATNVAGCTSTQAKLNLEAPPKVRLPRQYEDGLLGRRDETFKLKVFVAGRPPPIVAWFHNTVMIEFDDRHVVETSETGEYCMRLLSAKREDRGEYTVKAINKLGTDSASFLLTVTDRPAAPGKTIVSMALERSIILSWSVPEDDGGCEIGNYIVEYYRIGWDVWLKAMTCRKPVTTLSKLIEGSEYKFRVKAENPYGVGDPGEESDVIFIPIFRRRLIVPQLHNIDTQSQRGIYQNQKIKSPNPDLPRFRNRTRSLNCDGSSRGHPEEFQCLSTESVLLRSNSGPSMRKCRADSRVTFDNIVYLPAERLSENTLDTSSHTVSLINKDEEFCDNGRLFEYQAVVPDTSSLRIVRDIPIWNDSESEFLKERSVSLIPIVGNRNSNMITSSTPQDPHWEGVKNSRIEKKNMICESPNDSELIQQRWSDVDQEGDISMIISSSERQAKRDLKHLVPPLLSQSLPELFTANHRVIEDLRKAVSSTEMLHERAMGKFYDALAVQAAVRRVSGISESRGGSDSDSCISKDTQLCSRLKSRSPDQFNNAPMIIPKERIPQMIHMSPEAHLRVSRPSILSKSYFYGSESHKDFYGVNISLCSRPQSSIKLNWWNDSDILKGKGFNELSKNNDDCKKKRDFNAEAVLNSNLNPEMMTSKIHCSLEMNRHDGLHPQEKLIPHISKLGKNHESSHILNPCTISLQPKSILKKRFEGDQIPIDQSVREWRKPVGIITTIKETSPKNVTNVSKKTIMSDIESENTSLLNAADVAKNRRRLNGKLAIGDEFLCEEIGDQEANTAVVDHYTEIVKKHSITYSPNTIDRRRLEQCNINRNSSMDFLPSSKRKLLPENLVEFVAVKMRNEVHAQEDNKSSALETMLAGQVNNSEQEQTDAMQAGGSEMNVSKEPRSTNVRVGKTITWMETTKNSSFSPSPAKTRRGVSHDKDVIAEPWMYPRSGTHSQVSSGKCNELTDEDLTDTRSPLTIVIRRIDPKSIERSNRCCSGNSDDHPRLKDDSDRKETLERLFVGTKIKFRSDLGYSIDLALLAVAVDYDEQLRYAKPCDVRIDDGMVDSHSQQCGGNHTDYHSLIVWESTLIHSPKNIASIGGLYGGIQMTKNHLSDDFRAEEPPIFVRRLTDLEAKIGTRIRFFVGVRSCTPIKISWHKNDELIHEGSRVSFIYRRNSYVMDVAPVMIDDHGYWTCIAENHHGRSSCTSHLCVIVPGGYKRPKFIEELHAFPKENGIVSLECKVMGVPTPLLRWFKDENEIGAGDIFALETGAAFLTPLGTYRCEASNCMGTVSSSSRVHVFGIGLEEHPPEPTKPVKIPESLPIFEKILTNKSCRIGKVLSLTCQLQVPPWPKMITWYNNSGLVENNVKYHLLEDGLGSYSIKVKGIETTDGGEWKCVAVNGEDSMQVTTCYVTVLIPKNFRMPEFIEVLKAVLTVESMVSFRCKVIGFPIPLLTWFKDGLELKPGNVYQLNGVDSLGSYSCIAQNCMGRAISEVELTLEDIQEQLTEVECLFQISTNRAPMFIRSLMSCEANIDENFAFITEVGLSAKPTLTWYRDDQLIIENEKYEMSKKSNHECHLKIEKLEFMDQAEWKCVIECESGHSMTSCFLKLTIPKHFNEPKFFKKLRATLSEEGVILKCKVMGVPRPVVKWYKDNIELETGDIHEVFSARNGTHSLGKFTCEATNCMGSVNSSVSLLSLQNGIHERGEGDSVFIVLGEHGENPSIKSEKQASQSYNTVDGNAYGIQNDCDSVSIDLDEGEMSDDLYGTPNSTKDVTLQIVKTYANQLSNRITENNYRGLSPSRSTEDILSTAALYTETIISDRFSYDIYVNQEADNSRTGRNIEYASVMRDKTQGHMFFRPMFFFDREWILLPQIPFPNLKVIDDFTGDHNSEYKINPRSSSHSVSLRVISMNSLRISMREYGTSVGKLGRIEISPFSTDNIWRACKLFADIFGEIFEWRENGSIVKDGINSGRSREYNRSEGYEKLMSQSSRRNKRYRIQKEVKSEMWKNRLQGADISAEGTSGSLKDTLIATGLSEHRSSIDIPYGSMTTGMKNQFIKHIGNPSENLIILKKRLVDLKDILSSSDENRWEERYLESLIGEQLISLKQRHQLENQIGKSLQMDVMRTEGFEITTVTKYLSYDKQSGDLLKTFRSSDPSNSQKISVYIIRNASSLDREYNKSNLLGQLVGELVVGLETSIFPLLIDNRELKNSNKTGSHSGLVNHLQWMNENIVNDRSTIWETQEKKSVKFNVQFFLSGPVPSHSIIQRVKRGKKTRLGCQDEDDLGLIMSGTRKKCRGAEISTICREQVEGKYSEKLREDVQMEKVDVMETVTDEGNYGKQVSSSLPAHLDSCQSPLEKHLNDMIHIQAKLTIAPLVYTTDHISNDNLLPMIILPVCVNEHLECDSFFDLENFLRDIQLASNFSSSLRRSVSVQDITGRHNNGDNVFFVAKTVLEGVLLDKIVLDTQHSVFLEIVTNVFNANDDWSKLNQASDESSILLLTLLRHYIVRTDSFSESEKSLDKVARTIVKYVSLGNLVTVHGFFHLMNDSLETPLNASDIHRVIRFSGPIPEAVIGSERRIPWSIRLSDCYQESCKVMRAMICCNLRRSRNATEWSFNRMMKLYFLNNLTKNEVDDIKFDKKCKSNFPRGKGDESDRCDQSNTKHESNMEYIGNGGAIPLGEVIVETTDFEYRVEVSLFTREIQDIVEMSESRNIQYENQILDRTMREISFHYGRRNMISVHAENYFSGMISQSIRGKKRTENEGDDSVRMYKTVENTMGKILRIIQNMSDIEFMGDHAIVSSSIFGNRSYPPGACDLPDRSMTDHDSRTSSELVDGLVNHIACDGSRGTDTGDVLGPESTLSKTTCKTLGIMSIGDASITQGYTHDLAIDEVHQRNHYFGGGKELERLSSFGEEDVRDLYLMNHKMPHETVSNRGNEETISEKLNHGKAVIVRSINAVKIHDSFSECSQMWQGNINEDIIQDMRTESDENQSESTVTNFEQAGKVMSRAEIFEARKNADCFMIDQVSGQGIFGPTDDASMSIKENKIGIRGDIAIGMHEALGIYQINVFHTNETRKIGVEKGNVKVCEREGLMWVDGELRENVECKILKESEPEGKRTSVNERSDTEHENVSLRRKGNEQEQRKTMEYEHSRSDLGNREIHHHRKGYKQRERGGDGSRRGEIDNRHVEDANVTVRDHVITDDIKKSQGNSRHQNHRCGKLEEESEWWVKRDVNDLEGEEEGACENFEFRSSNTNQKQYRYWGSVDTCDEPRKAPPNMKNENSNGKYVQPEVRRASKQINTRRGVQTEDGLYHSLSAMGKLGNNRDGMEYESVVPVLNEKAGQKILLCGESGITSIGWLTKAARRQNDRTHRMKEFSIILPGQELGRLSKNPPVSMMNIMECSKDVQTSSEAQVGNYTKPTPWTTSSNRSIKDSPWNPIPRKYSTL